MLYGEKQKIARLKFIPVIIFNFSFIVNRGEKSTFHQILNCPSSISSDKDFIHKVRLDGVENKKLQMVEATDDRTSALSKKHCH